MYEYGLRKDQLTSTARSIVRVPTSILLECRGEPRHHRLPWTAGSGGFGADSSPSEAIFLGALPALLTIDIRSVTDCPRP
jgi:hypothetical protein